MKILKPLHIFETNEKPVESVRASSYVQAVIIGEVKVILSTAEELGLLLIIFTLTFGDKHRLRHECE